MNIESTIFSSALCSHFIRECPRNKLYLERLSLELKLIKDFKFEQVFLQVLDILHLAKGIPHLIRGSAASSLVCYLLGISNIDPIKENISLTRFMNNYLPDIPDIDIDFPYNRRDEIIEKLKALYGERVARISNHVKYKESSALREAVRMHGYRKFLPKNFDIYKIFPQNANEVLKTAHNLVGKFRGYSLHCGGIVIFDAPVQSKLLLKPGQIKMDKREVEEQRLIKIDLLCNRGMAQLWEISQQSLESYPDSDKETAALFCRGDILGITFSESPAMKRLVQAIQPRNRREIAICLALVRPAAASRGRKLSFLKHWQKHRKKTQIVYDDDATDLIEELLNISPGEADFYRRAFAKGDEQSIGKFQKLIEHMPNADEHIENLSMMREYSFCKSHALSYSYLVWALAYWKTRDPKKFWHATLMHCQSMYAQWVHVSEAKKAGLNLCTVGPNWQRLDDDLYDPQRSPFLFHDGFQEYKKYGYWLSKRFMPGCTAIQLGKNIRIIGLIASYRRYSSENTRITFVSVGTSNGVYWDLVIEGSFSLHNFDILEVEGEVKTFFNSHYVKVSKLIALRSLKQNLNASKWTQSNDIRANFN